MDYLAIIIITLMSGVLGTGLGGVVGAVLRRESNKVVSLLLSFAGGIMLAVVCFDLMNQPIEMMKEGTLPSYTPIIVVLAVIVGYAVVYLLKYAIDKRADHFESHKEEQYNSRSNLFVAGLVMMMAIALHNLPEDGILYFCEEKSLNRASWIPSSF